MDKKFFMHRIKKDKGEYVKGIEVHETEDSAIGSFHAYMKQGYNNPNSPNITYVACMVTDMNGNIIPGYNEAWIKEGEEISEIFLHHIKDDNGTFTKDIDIFASAEPAISAFHDYMAYGYNNSKFPHVNYVSCMISGWFGDIKKSGNWIRLEE